MNEDTANVDVVEENQVTDGGAGTSTAADSTPRKPLLSKSVKLILGAAVVLLVFVNVTLYAAPGGINEVLPSFIAEPLGISGQEGCSALQK